jgi:hypothetical protein
MTIKQLSGKRKEIKIILDEILDYEKLSDNYKERIVQLFEEISKIDKRIIDKKIQNVKKMFKK